MIQDCENLVGVKVDYKGKFINLQKFTNQHILAELKTNYVFLDYTGTKYSTHGRVNCISEKNV